MGKKTSSAKKKKKALSKSASLQKPKYKLSSAQWVSLAILLAITLICFFPALQAEFVNWDDDRNFYENELITTLNSENFFANLKSIFVTPVIGNYNPLPIATFAIEQRLFGLDQPFYWHLNNILLHLGCIALVYMIGLRMSLSTLGALLLAGLFAVHPMRVESVAWVTERKDVLFGLFYLWGMLLYIKTKVEDKSIWRSVAILLCFVLSLFSKIQAVIFPVTLILIDYWFSGTITWKSIFSKVHLFAFSIGFGLLGIYFLRDQGSLDSSADYTFFERIFVGSFSYFIYYVKAIIPFRLSPLYPYPSNMPAYFYPSILSFVAGGAALLYTYFKGLKTWFFGIAFFTVNIFFLLQILGAGQGFMADRFTYIAYFGLFFIAAYYFDHYTTNLNTPIKYAILALPLLSYGVMTFQQSRVWTNSGTLWTHVLKYYNKVTLPYGNRANYYRDIGETEKALADYAATIALDGSKAGPYNSRARLFFDSGKNSDLPKALEEYNKAIEIEPLESEYYTNRGATYARLGKLNEALSDLNKAIEINPQFANAYLNRSVINSQLNNVDGAISDIETHLSFKPYNPDLWYECGRLKNLKNNYAGAIPNLNKAIQYNPNKGMYYVERGKALFSTGQGQQAIADIQRAKSLGYAVPDNVWNTIMQGR